MTDPLVNQWVSQFPEPPICQAAFQAHRLHYWAPGQLKGISMLGGIMHVLMPGLPIIRLANERPAWVRGGLDSGGNSHSDGVVISYLWLSHHETVNP